MLPTMRKPLIIVIFLCLFIIILLQSMAESAIVQSLLKSRPDCESVLPSMWHAGSPESRGPPIWVKIPFSYRRLPTKAFADGAKTQTPSMVASIPAGSDAGYSQCLTLLWQQLSVKKMPMSNHKAMRASRDLFW